mmetsp:Transcript_3376/g.13067  ORF Transcript_3376/g.13067 Transcript_3376/m.13067 type:complete len:217 (-) Transcript_3376:1447-2097(-)
MQLWMRRRVYRDFKQRLENVIEHLLEVFHRPITVVDVVQSRYLNHPYDIFAEDVVIQHPSREIVPFAGFTPIDGDAILGHGVFVRLQVRAYLLRELGEEPTTNQVVLLDENFSQARLSHGVVLEIEPIEAMKRILVRVHVQCIDVEFVCRHSDRFEHLSKVQKLAVPINHKFVRLSFKLGLDEAQQVLLVHARAVMHVRINLSDVVKVAMWRLLLL